MTGPLAGLRVLEIAGVGPGPHCAMLLADMGADVLRIDRVRARYRVHARTDLLNRGRRSAALDLKQPRAIEAVLALAERADVLLEGFRPGVMERLGLGPEPVLARNPKLVYARLTGWGQEGPLAQAAGHDLNYLALTGALHAIGPASGPPVPPLNLAGDFGGGALYAAFGILAALFERERSGRGQIVDAAMVDGAASLMTFVQGLAAAGWWRDEREANLIDGGAPFYRCYETRDGKWVALGAIEPEFYDAFLKLTGLDDEALPKRMDRGRWPELTGRFQRLFLTRSREEWCELLEGTNACFAPVLSLEEAPGHPHMAARDALATSHGIVQSGPAPRFSRTPGRLSRPPPAPGEDTQQALADWGLDPADIDALISSGAALGESGDGKTTPKGRTAG